MNEIDHFKVFVLCSDDVTTDVDHLYVKRIHLVSFSYRAMVQDFKMSYIYVNSYINFKLSKI
jgi:hypothetical protein